MNPSKHCDEIILPKIYTKIGAKWHPWYKHLVLNLDTLVQSAKRLDLNVIHHTEHVLVFSAQSRNKLFLGYNTKFVFNNSQTL